MKTNEKIIKYRKDNNLSQEQLAEKIGVTRQSISKWEAGQSQPSNDNLTELSKVFNISIARLLDDDFILPN